MFDLRQIIWTSVFNYHYQHIEDVGASSSIEAAEKALKIADEVCDYLAKKISDPTGYSK